MTAEADRSGALSGRVALVTGSTRNIGRAIALAFARAGAAVVVNGRRDEDALAATLRDVAEAGAEGLGVLADVADPAALADLVARATERFGRIDVAVSNVGLRLRQPFPEIGPDDWRRVLATNLDAPFHLARLVLPGMVERRWGRLLHVSGYDGFAGNAKSRAHNVTAKAGMHGLTKALAREYGPHGVTANTVVPGFVETERDPAQYPRLGSHREEILARTPVGRVGTPEDVAAACLYLAGDAASFVTGVALHVNGGEYMV